MGFIKAKPVIQHLVEPIQVPMHKVEWSKLVSLDFETFYDEDYTLSKLSTSEYIRDPRFEALMVGVKIGRRKTVVVPGPKIKAYLAKIDWKSHSVLAHNCVPGDTEVLTRAGWKRIDEADDTQEIMQWNSATNQLSWITPLAKVEHRGTELIRWNTEFHRGAYTPEHRMYYNTPDRADWRAEAADAVSRMGQNNVRIPVSGIYDAPEISMSEGVARLMEAIRADGSWTLHKGLCYGARFKLKKERKVERLRELCEHLGIELKTNGISYRICKNDIVESIFNLLGRAKQYGPWVMSLPLTARLAILTELKYWDGHDRGMSKGFSWSCANTRTVDAIELMAHTSGWSVSGNWRRNARGFNELNLDAKLYVGTIRERSQVKLVRSPTREAFTGKVYCFTVPTGAFMIRAGGRVCITGNCQFDGFILSHHYKVVPKFYYCTMSMGRGLHSNEIGAGLDEVAKFYGREGKLVGGVEGMKGLRYKDLVRLKKYDDGARYCGRDVDEMYGIFEQMVAKMPDDEIGLIDLTVRMFCDPVLRVNIPRVEAELAREIAERERLFMNVVPHNLYEKPGQEKELKALLKTGAERQLQGKERIMLKAKRILGSNDKFADLLRAEGVEPPVKISPAWIKKPAAERKDEDKWAYAFAKDDADFINLPDDVESLAAGLDLNKKADVKALVKRQERLRLLVDCRLAVKSTTNITRAQRFLTAGAGGMRLPAGYAYARAHTLRWGGINKMNLQNLTRGGELRQSIEAETPKHELCVSDSGQIECRQNAWMWDQDDLLDSFRTADEWDESTQGLATGNNRDAYCKAADGVYGFEVTKANKMERFVGKVITLALGFQMGAAKLQITLARGALGGPPVFFTLDECKKIVNTYRLKNYRIVAGWKICERIIEDMAAGRTGSHKCISWGKETIYLPNGLTLKYPQLKKTRNEEKGWEEWSYMSGVVRKKLYPGLLCENLIQCLARIIVGWQMLQISKKYRVVMTTHDEVVVNVLATRAEAALKFMLKWMRTPPEWCADIPLNAEGGHAPNYSK